jgi:hypothetical protein
MKHLHNQLSIIGVSIICVVFDIIIKHNPIPPQTLFFIHLISLEIIYLLILFFYYLYLKFKK